MFKRILTAGLLFGMAATGPPAHAASCGDRETLIDRLETQFSEQLIAGGLQSVQSVVEVWASPETGTFTVLVTNTQGISCVLTTGNNWFHEEPQIKPAGIPS
ncbi:MAG: hypothetical protein KUG69_11120 [Marinosulfonomonas sp.]|nr:hypothetical protein [Marinosulfonomonas sp.]